MTSPNDFAFNDTLTRLVELTPEGIKASNPPLSKREYFAAMAMQGILASYAGVNQIPLPDYVSKDSVAFADALIKALNDQK